MISVPVRDKYQFYIMGIELQSFYLLDDLFVLSWSTGINKDDTFITHEKAISTTQRDCLYRGRHV